MRWESGRTEPSAPVFWENQGQGWEGLPGCPSLCPPPTPTPQIIRMSCQQRGLAMADRFLGMRCSGKGCQGPPGHAHS